MQNQKVAYVKTNEAKPIIHPQRRGKKKIHFRFKQVENEFKSSDEVRTNNGLFQAL